MKNLQTFWNTGSNRKIILIASAIIILVCSILPTIIFPSTPNEPTSDANAVNTAAIESAIALNLLTLSAQTPTPETVPTELPLPTATLLPLASPTQAFAAAGAECIPNNPPLTGQVVDVVDGDTIKVLLDQDGNTYSVRYIGMDTPENTTKIEYFGIEATAKNAELVSGKTVTLIKDVSETDRYNRLLRYVLVNGTFVNYQLVAQGYANTASYPPDIACIPTFQDAERQASASALGLWAAPPTSAPLPTQPPSGGSAVCDCSGNNYNCPDFNTHSEAQACYNYCKSLSAGDIHRLDSDGDGSVCENLP